MQLYQMALKKDKDSAFNFRHDQGHQLENGPAIFLQSMEVGTSSET